MVAYASYLGKTIWPMDLAIFYPLQKKILPLAIVLSIALLVVISIFVAGERQTVSIVWLAVVFGNTRAGHRSAQGQALADCYIICRSSGSLSWS